ncbi:MAG: asparagine synthase (glutamine-hydrolyzing) [Planctomycetota bacterium]
MCGIVGVRTFKPRGAAELTGWIDRQLSLIEHRGRDEVGSHVEGGVGLGITRLSVIDLDSGSQPISSPDGRYVIVYNGEVYNYAELRSDLAARGYPFRTNSDTEVVLAAYAMDGAESLNRLNGMFAFAIHDRDTDELILIRDRFGIKPLFYYADADLVCFSSELKAILCVPGVRRAIDPEALTVFLSHNYLPPPLTLMQGVRQLPPGHALRVKRDGRVTLEQWHRWTPEPQEHLSTNELDERFGLLFERAVTRQLVSDVPLGAFLSGGLDSTALVAVMAEKKPGRTKTFSVGFDEKGYNESPFALEVAEHLGTDHYPIRLGAEAFFELVTTVIPYQDHLVADQATVPLFALSQLARRHVTVCLSGDGGDEVLGGYTTILADQYQPLVRCLPGPARRVILKTLDAIGAGTGKVSWDYKLRAFLQGAGLSREDAHATWRMLHTTASLRRLLSPDMQHEADWLYQPYRRAFAEFSAAPFARRAEMADIRVWLAGNNFTKVDAMTMGANLEARVPFLDNDLVDFLLRVPLSQKVRGHTLKVILRRYLRRKGIPPRIVNRGKAGFHSPIAGWFKGILRDRLRDILAPPHGLYSDKIIRQGEPLRLLDEHAAGRSNNAFRLFALVLLFRWYDAVFRAGGNASVEQTRVLLGRDDRVCTVCPSG